MPEPAGVSDEAGSRLVPQRFSIDALPAALESASVLADGPRNPVGT